MKNLRLIYTNLFIILLTSCSKETDLVAEYQVLEVEQVSKSSKTYTRIAHAEGNVMEYLRDHRETLGFEDIERDQGLQTYSDSHTTFQINLSETTQDNWEDRKAAILQATGATEAFELVGSNVEGGHHIANVWLNDNEARTVLDNPNFTHYAVTAMLNDDEIYYYTIIFITK